MSIAIYKEVTIRDDKWPLKGSKRNHLLSVYHYQYEMIQTYQNSDLGLTIKSKAFAV